MCFIYVLGRGEGAAGGLVSLLRFWSFFQWFKLWMGCVGW